MPQILTTPSAPSAAGCRARAPLLTRGLTYLTQLRSESEIPKLDDSCISNPANRSMQSDCQSVRSACNSILWISGFEMQESSNFGISDSERNCVKYVNPLVSLSPCQELRRRQDLG